MLRGYVYFSFNFQHNIMIIMRLLLFLLYIYIASNSIRHDIVFPFTSHDSMLMLFAYGFNCPGCHPRRKQICLLMAIVEMLMHLHFYFAKNPIFSGMKGCFDLLLHDRRVSEADSVWGDFWCWSSLIDILWTDAAQLVFMHHSLQHISVFSIKYIAPTQSYSHLPYSISMFVKAEISNCPLRTK